MISAHARQKQQLLWQLTLRDIDAKYRGAQLGWLWALLAPLLMVAMYTLLFSVVFQARWGQMQDHVSYGVMIYAGLVLHGFLMDVISRSTACIVGQANLVKKVVFPPVLLPTVVVLSSAFQLVLGIAVLLVAASLVGFAVTWHVVWLPVVLLPFLLLSLGLAWALASLGVYLRDLQQVMPFLGNALLFTSPILFPRDAMPELIRPWLLLNPLSAVTEQVRRVALEGHAPDWSLWAGAMGVGLCVAALGWWWFDQTRKGFADVL